MVLKGVDLSISCPSGDIGAIRFACHQGVFTFATCIERRFHCLFLMIVGGFQFQMRSFCSIFQFIQIGISIYNWVILLIPCFGMLSLHRDINVFFMNSLVPTSSHLWRRPHGSLNFTFVESWLSIWLRWLICPYDDIERLKLLVSFLFYL